MTSPTSMPHDLHEQFQTLQSQMKAMDEKRDQSLRVIEILERQEQGIQELYEITSSQHLPFKDRIQGLLELGCRRFQLSLGYCQLNEN